jgi:endonuclease IV
MAASRFAPVRVREALDVSECRAALRGKLPRDAAAAPEYPRVSYPQAILRHFAGGESYATLGLVTEHLLRREAIDRAALEEVLREFTPNALPPRASLESYLQKVRATRAQVLALAEGERLQYDTVVRGKGVEGHPDIRTSADVFEVKTSGNLRKSWPYFVLQVFAYGALDPAARRVHLVLPLQAAVWSFDLAGWAKRQPFREALEGFVAGRQQRELDFEAPGPSGRLKDEIAIGLAFALFPIGSHIGKKDDLVGTLAQVAGVNRPWQIFLGGATTTNVRISDQELAEAQQLIANNHMVVFVHASYLINLCALNHYNVSCLRKILGYARSIGARGVVVHVGKRHCTRTLREGEEAGSSTTAAPTTEATAKGKRRSVEETVLSEAEGLANMAANIRGVLDAASAECPLLAETASSQGTEVLTRLEDFADFCASFADPRIGIVVDTAHVFASGYLPSEYMRTLLSHTEWRQLPKLVHFNDSEQLLGSHLDRHAPPGLGFIGGTELHAVAEMAVAANIPLVRE